MSREPSRNDDAPEESVWDEKVRHWIEACPFPLYSFDEQKLWEMSDENTMQDGD